MPLLPPELINKALKLNLLRVNGTPQVAAHSIDLSITNAIWNGKNRKAEIPQEGFILEPQQQYKVKLDSRLFLAQGLIGEITTRSSYARLGIQVDPQPSIENLFGTWRDRGFTAICNLETFGTQVRIRPYEHLAQIFIHTQLETMLANEIKDAMDSEDLIVYDKGHKLDRTNASFGEALELHMEDLIYVYKKGRILDPQDKDHSEDFETVNLRHHPKGYYLPKGAFFISSCRERFATSNRCVAYVTPTINLRPAMTKTNFPDPKHFTRFPFLTHPNAPYHAYGLRHLQQMTFENYVTEPEGVYLHADCKQAELVLVPFLTPSSQEIESRYTGQIGATLRRPEQ